MTAVQPRDSAGRFASWMFATGPLPLLERPSTAELPPLHTALHTSPVRREANGAVLVADNPDVPNRWRVRVRRDPAGRLTITYLDESWTR